MTYSALKSCPISSGRGILPPLLAVLLAAASVFTTSCGEQTEEKRISFALPETNQTAQWTLPNGARLLVLPRTEAPVVTISLRIYYGFEHELQPEHAGISNLLTLAIGRDDGPAAKGFQKLGSSMATQLSADSITLTTTVLAEDAAEAVELIFSALPHNLPEPDITALRDRLIDSLSSSGYSPAELAYDTAFTLLLPGSQRWPVQTRIDSLRRLDAEQLRSLIGERTGAQLIRAVIVGDVNNAALSALGRRLISLRRTGWSESRPEEAAAEDVAIRLVDSAGSEATLYFARRLSPPVESDYYGRLAVNFILNGSTTGQRLAALPARTAQNVSSAIANRRGAAGHLIRATSPTQSAGEAVRLVVAVLNRLREGTLGGARLLEQEVADARNSLRGNLLRGAETTAQLADFMLRSAELGMSEHSVAYHLSLIEDIDRDSLLALIRRDFGPGLSALVVLGPAGQLSSRLEELGEVEVIEP